jgi:hypothetical protein
MTIMQLKMVIMHDAPVDNGIETCAYSVQLERIRIKKYSGRSLNPNGVREMAGGFVHIPGFGRRNPPGGGGLMSA